MVVLPTHVEDLKTLLVKNGFLKSSSKEKYVKQESGEYGLKEGGGVNPDDADMELAEEVNIRAGSYLHTGYPSPNRRYKLIIESSSANIEEPYYWLIEHAKQDMAYPFAEKITDTFSSSEQSAFWGAAQSRLGIQQDRVSQYLRGISEMIKQLFQLVRELRILDEKMAPRNEWTKSKAADLALKGEYTDLVENRGGQVQPGSIYHLAQTVGYTILPDLFFNTQVFSLDAIDSKVNELKYNPNVKNVLRRKLYAFINWKTKTDAELQTRRKFTLKYLRQHWNTIKMYMNWVKPYLRNIARMQMNPADIESPDIVGAFETSVIELETLAYKPDKDKHDMFACVLMSFRFRTRPEMSYHQDNYQHKGPIHMGKVEIALRSYAWSKGQIEAYKKYRRQEDMQLMGLVDTSVKDAMEALGEDLENYLYEAGEKEFAEKKKAQEALEKKQKATVESGSMNVFDPFLAIFQGFGEMFSVLGGSAVFSLLSPKSGPNPFAAKKASKAAAKTATFDLYQIYKNFKKSHGLLSW